MPADADVKCPRCGGKGHTIESPDVYLPGESEYRAYRCERCHGTGRTAEAAWVSERDLQHFAEKMLCGGGNSVTWQRCQAVAKAYLSLRSQLAALRAQPSPLGNLLAVIFRDGGHRQAAIGDDAQAVEEASAIVSDLRQQIDALRAQPPTTDDDRAFLDGTLAYIASSPAQGNGGFHTNAVRAAKLAIAELARLRGQAPALAETAELREAASSVALYYGHSGVSERIVNAAAVIDRQAAELATVRADAGLLAHELENLLDIAEHELRDPSPQQHARTVVARQTLTEYQQQRQKAALAATRGE